MKNLFLFSLLIFFLAPISCFAEGPQDKFTVGVIAPLSGGLAEYGVALKNGFDLAEKDSPELFKNLEFLFEDSRYDNKLALSAFNKLSGSDLIFSWGSGPTETIAPIAERMKFPLVAMGEYTSAVGRSHVIIFTPPSFLFSESLVKHLRSKGYKRFAIVLGQITYLETLANSFKKSLLDHENMKIIDTYQPGDNDFKTTITKISKQKPDALGVYLLSGQISQFYRQMAAQKLKIPTFGTDFFESTTEIKEAGSAMEGAVYPHNIVSIDFKKKYLSLHGNDIQLPTAARGYDFAMLVGRQLKQLSNASGLELFESLKKVKSASGVSGPYKFQNSPETGMYFYFPIAVKEIRNGKISLLTER